MNLDLVDKIRKGDREAEQALVLHYLEEIRTIVRYHLGGRNQYVEDLTNDICVALLGNLRNGNFDVKQAKLGSYIYGIARNKIADFKKLELSTRKEDVSERDIPVVPEISKRLEDEELLDIMRRELPKLKPKYRIVLLLRYYQERTIPEIAEIIGISKDQVSERIYYAKQLLQKKCQKFFPEN